METPTETATMLPETHVLRNTSDESRRRIKREIETSVRFYARRLEQIDQRLAEIQSAWDIERTLEANAATLMLLGLTVGRLFRGMRLLPMVTTVFLAQHAFQGWCPPLPVFRRMGIRTVQEQEQERYALKALRGDFAELGASEEDPETRAEQALKAVDFGKR